MILFTICLDSLLRLLDDTLNDVPTRRRKKRTAVIAYADDVTIILKDPHDIQKLHAAIRLYAEASGAEHKQVGSINSSIMEHGTNDFRRTLQRHGQDPWDYYDQKPKPFC